MKMQQKYVFGAVGVLSALIVIYALTRKGSKENPKVNAAEKPVPKGLAGLEPAARKKVEQFFALAKKAGKPLLLVSARRGCAKQDALYAQGRTKPGRIITYAKCGQSDHNLGLAIDVAPLVNGKVNYKVPRSHWEELAKIAESVGLHWGGRWKNLNDLVHFSAGSR